MGTITLDSANQLIAGVSGLQSAEDRVIVTRLASLVAAGPPWHSGDIEQPTG